MNFVTAYDEYLEYAKNRQKYQSYNAIVERFNSLILPYFKDYDIYNIDKLDYIKYQNYLIQKKYSYYYIRNTHYYLVAFFNYCMDFYNLDKNIFKSVGLPKIQNNKRKDNYITTKEFKKFIKYVYDPVYKSFFEFLFYTGCRSGETMALKFSDINKNVISITKTIDEHPRGHERIVTTPKSESSIRNITIPLILSIKINKLKKYYIEKYDTLQDFYIFGGLKPLAPTTINRYKKQAFIKSGVKEITLHGFRHSHATMLLEKNVSIKAISERLGHSNTEITTSVYLHNTPKQEKRLSIILNLMSIFVH